MALLSRLIHCSLTAGLLLISVTSYAESGRADYDLDSDGLIEINDLADLDDIRNNLDGSSLYGESVGCPVEGCIGFELTSDLDFDTNSDGLINSDDDYWNGGEGWVPIGGPSSEFTADLHGNGYTISNLFANRPNVVNDQAFIGSMLGNTVESLHLVDVSIAGRTSAGGLVGYAESALIEEVVVTGTVKVYLGTGAVGGIGATLSNSTCRGCVVAGNVRDRSPASGIGGISGQFGVIENSLSIATVDSRGETTAGVVGETDDKTLIQNTLVIGKQGVAGNALTGDGGVAEKSYWATDTTGRINSGVGSATDVSGVLLGQLQCPSQANDSQCAGITLFKDWQLVTNKAGQAIWSFGSDGQLPGLNVAGKLIRDSDGDGVLDRDDAFPNQFEISLDADGDGYSEQFNPWCEEACQNSSSVQLDVFPDDPSEYFDSDHDGVGNNADNDDDNDGVLDDFDALPFDPSESVDTDHDGIGNNADPDDDNDGVLDADDVFPFNANESADADSDGLGDNQDIDDDNDMMTDVWEETNGFDPLDSSDALLDADSDGVSNLDEFESGSDPRDADSVPSWLQGGGAWKYYLYKKAAEGATLQ